jgi:uncharacterized protein (UPF0335 family)
LETESNNAINFLDITIQHKENRLAFNIYRKPTATDIIIHRTSCHPPEQKQAAIRHMINRMNTYKLDNNTKRQEMQIIEQIARENGFDTSVVHDINKQKEKRRERKYREMGQIHISRKSNKNHHKAV